MATTSASENSATLNSLLEQLEEIRPILEQERDEGERLGRLTDKTVATLKRVGFLRLYQPKSYGGLEVDPVSCFQLIERVSRIDTNAGWQMGISNSVTHIACARWPEAVTDTIFGDDPDALICGSLNSMGKAVPEGDGYRFTSQAPFNSGCRFSDWCMMQGRVERDSVNEDEGPQIIAVCCSMKDAEIIDNWDVVGMRATGSNDVRVQDVFVPGAWQFSIESLGGPPTNSRYDSDLFRMPLCHHVPLAFATVLGALGASLRWVADLAQNKIPIFATSKLRTRSIAQIDYGKALGRYRAAQVLMESALERVWAKIQAGQEATPEDKAEIYLSAVQGMEMIADGIRLAASVAGTSWIRKGNPLERAVRDVEVLRHHAYINEGRYGTVAQVHWGMEPDFGFIAV